jgi:hypothetical protein
LDGIAGNRHGRLPVVAADDELSVDELVLAEGGQWSGLLFQSRAAGASPALTWGFEFRYGDVERDFGTSPVNIQVDWLPLPVANWREMAGQSIDSLAFAEPGEASLYWFQHHRFEAIYLRILEQRDADLHVQARTSGDLDRLGIDTVSVDAWVAFAGITVSLPDISDAGAALGRLQQFTDTSGLTHVPGTPHGHFRFAARS